MVSKRHYHDIKHSRGGITFQCGGTFQENLNRMILALSWVRISKVKVPMTSLNVIPNSIHCSFWYIWFHSISLWNRAILLPSLFLANILSSCFGVKNTHWQLRIYFREFMIWEAVDKWKNLSPISFGEILINSLFICLNGHWPKFKPLGRLLCVLFTTNMLRKVPIDDSSLQLILETKTMTQ